jgi:hypothetical protein
MYEGNWLENVRKLNSARRSRGGPCLLQRMDPLKIDIFSEEVVETLK